MRSVSTEHIQTAYRKLKRLTYFDKTDLNLRLKLAEFECDADFEENLLSITQVVNSDDPLQEALFQRIKGGENLTFLTMKLNLKALRDHQWKGYGLQKDLEDFKPTPPGFKDADVKARIQLGGAGAV